MRERAEELGGECRVWWDASVRVLAAGGDSGLTGAMTEVPRRLRILIADDQPMFRLGLRAMLVGGCWDGSRRRGCCRGGGA